MSSNLQVNYELEEGEILEDMLPKKKKIKKLPRRYMHPEGTINTKHTKRKCKHSKKCSKIKKNVQGKQTKPLKSLAFIRSCDKTHFHHLSHSLPLGQGTKPKVLYDLKQENKYSLYETFSNTNKSKTKIKSPLSDPKRFSPTVENCNLSKEPTFEDMLIKYKTMQTELKQVKKETMYVAHDYKGDACRSVRFRVRKSPRQDFSSNTTSHQKMENSDHCSMNSLQKTVPDSTSKQCDDEESEDEQVLRIKALASCLKHTISTNEKLSPSNYLSDMSESLDQGKNCSLINNETMDNYKVIDMEIDEDSQIPVIEVTEISNNLMTENTPTLIKENETPPITCNNDFKNDCSTHDNLEDDFDVIMLRAQLILSMQKQKHSNRSDDKTASSDECVSTNAADPELSNCQSVILRKPLRKTEVACSEAPSIKATSDSTQGDDILDKMRFVPHERIVINIDDSSSEESNSSDDDNETTDSQVCIEDLMSSAQKQSQRIVKLANDMAPQAVSCLSKAQQEEYNQLKKIIAQKEAYQTQQKSLHSSTDDLKLLEGKLTQAILTFKKEKHVMNCLKTQVVKKRATYSKSRLIVQRLKAQLQRIKIQLIAAESSEKASLQLFMKNLSELQTVKKSMPKMEALIGDLRNKCLKLGTSISGNKYNLPSNVLKEML